MERHPDLVHEEAKKLLQEAKETAECVGGICLRKEAVFKAQEATVRYDNLIREYGPDDNGKPILKDFVEIKEEACKANLFTSYLEVLSSDYEGAEFHANSAMALSDMMDVEYQKGKILKIFSWDQTEKYDTTGFWEDAAEQINYLEREEKARCVNLLGRLHQAKGQWEYAINHFKRAVLLDPKLAIAAKDLKKLYSMEEDFVQFVASFGVAQEPMVNEPRGGKETVLSETVPALDIIADRAADRNEYIHRTGYFYRMN